MLGRILTLLGHYWREDDPSEMNEAMGRDWADILEGMPQDAIGKACMAYLRSEPRRKPTPGAIYALAREYLPPLVVAGYKPYAPAEKKRVTKEEAAEIMIGVGFVPRKFGGDEIG